MGGWKMHLQQQQAGIQLRKLVSDADPAPDWGAPDGTGGPHMDEGEGARGERAAPGQLGKPRNQAR